MSRKKTPKKRRKSALDDLAKFEPEQSPKQQQVEREKADSLKQINAIINKLRSNPLFIALSIGALFAIIINNLPLKITSTKKTTPETISTRFNQFHQPIAKRHLKLLPEGSAQKAQLENLDKTSSQLVKEIFDHLFGSISLRLDVYHETATSTLINNQLRNSLATQGMPQSIINLNLLHTILNNQMNTNPNVKAEQVNVAYNFGQIGEIFPNLATAKRHQLSQLGTELLNKINQRKNIAAKKIRQHQGKTQSNPQFDINTATYPNTSIDKIPAPRIHQSDKGKLFATGVTYPEIKSDCDLMIWIIDKNGNPKPIYIRTITPEVKTKLHTTPKSTGFRTQLFSFPQDLAEYLNWSVLLASNNILSIPSNTTEYPTGVNFPELNQIISLIPKQKPEFNEQILP